MHVSDPYQLKAAPVRLKNIFTSWSEDGSLSELLPSLQVTKHEALSEVPDQVYETVLCEEVRHALAMQDPRFIEVHVQTPKVNGAPEALQGLLKVRQVLQRWEWQVRSNERGSCESGDNIAAYHVRTMVAHGLNTPPDRNIPRHQLNTALRSPSTVQTFRRTSHIVAKAIILVDLRLYFRLGQQHHVKNLALHRPDSLCWTKALAILDVQCTNGEPWWESGMAERRQWCRVKAVGAMGYRLVTYKWHPHRNQKDEKRRLENPHIGWYRIYSRSFSVALFFKLSETPILRGCCFRGYQPFGVGAAPPGFSPAAVLPVE